MFIRKQIAKEIENGEKGRVIPIFISPFLAELCILSVVKKQHRSQSKILMTNRNIALFLPTQH